MINETSMAMATMVASPASLTIHPRPPRRLPRPPRGGRRRPTGPGGGWRRWARGPRRPRFTPGRPVGLARPRARPEELQQEHNNNPTEHEVERRVDQQGGPEAPRVGDRPGRAQ